VSAAAQRRTSSAGKIAITNASCARRARRALAEADVDCEMGDGAVPDGI
jgi:hypothetical protein